jgi:hypothetical protein
MGGKFINTNRQDMINKATDSLIGRLDNKYKVMLQEKPANLIWFNKNIHYSTLDEGSGLEYEPIGKDSPTRFNRINNLLAYGLEKIQVQLEVGDFGVAGSEISGELVLLPDTITPYVGDFFIIPYIEEEYLFEITDVQYDTLNNDSNYYKVAYKLSGQDHKLPQLMKQVVDDYKVIIDNVGTNMKTVIKSTTYNLIENTETKLLKLKKYYKAMYYNSKVQTFIFYDKLHDLRIYDPYLIEFISKNGILTGDDEYLYICQQISLDPSFIMEYDTSFMNCMENKDINNILTYKMDYVTQLIRDITSIFDSRYEDYYRVVYSFPQELANYGLMKYIDTELVRSIMNNTLYDDNAKKYLNIIIMYMNSIELSFEDVQFIDKICFDKDDVHLFYLIPILIYCIENYIKELLVKHVDN